MRIPVVILGWLTLHAWTIRDANAKANADEVTTKFLTEAGVVDGVALPARTQLIYRAGLIHKPYLVRAILGGDGTPCGVSLPRGTTVWLSDAQADPAEWFWNVGETRLMRYRIETAHELEGVPLARRTDVTVRCEGTFNTNPGSSPTKLYAGTLGGTYRANRSAFPAGSVLAWHPSARERGVALALVPDGKHAIGPFIVPGPSRILFHPNGAIREINTLTTETHILDPQSEKRVLVVGAVRCSLTHSIVLFANGQLQECTLGAQQTIGGLFVANVVHDSASLHSRADRVAWFPNGQLRVASLPREQEIGGLFVDGDVAFYETGALASGRSSRVQTIGAFTFRGGFELAPSGALKAAAPDEDLEVGGLRLRSFALYESGALRYGYLSTSTQQRFGAVLLTRNPSALYWHVEHYVELFPSGALRVAYLPAQKIGGIEIQAGNVELHENAMLAQGVLGRDRRIDGLMLRKGSVLLLSPEGALLRGSSLVMSRDERKKLPAGSYVVANGRVVLEARRPDRPPASSPI